MAEFEFETLDNINKQLEDLVHEYQDHKNYFESDEDPDIEETRLRLQLLLEIVPKVKKRYYHLRREAQDVAAFDASYANHFGKSYLSLISKMKKLVGPDPSQLFESTRIMNGASSSNSHHRSPKIKFPVIKLPEFNGALDKWIEFRDKFESLVNGNPDLTNIEKFHYLHSAIQLPAGQQNVLQNFALSEDAYEEAWLAVRERYDDKRKLKSQQFNTLLTVKKMSGESPAELRRILDSFSSSFTALDLLGATNDDFRVHVVQYRLDDQTLKDWQKFLDDEEPTWPLMKEFLTKQWRTLDSVPVPQKRQQQLPGKSSDNKPHTLKSFAGSSPSPLSCVLCKNPHNLYSCPKFQAMSVSERFNFATEKGLCRNCLSSSHAQRNCTSSNRCKTCKKNHHSMLHFEKSPPAVSPEQQSQPSQPQLNPNSPAYNPVPMPRITYPSTSKAPATYHSTSVKTFSAHTEALLSTICFLVLGTDGGWRSCRALLDSGSQSNYITTQFATELGIELISACVPVIGVNGQASMVKKRTNVIYSSTYRSFYGDIDCLVSDDITGILPNRRIDISRLRIPSHLVLADPDFHVPSKIDMLLGTGIYHEALLGNIIALPDMPHFIETKFGWTVGGNFPVPSPSSSYISCFTQLPTSGLEEIDAKLEKFMEIEHYGSSQKILSPEERHCMNHFEATTWQDETGRIFSEYPVQSNIEQLGNNFGNASRQFFYQEKKRMEDPELNGPYVEYMKEFESSGHMTEVGASLKFEGHFLPHHGVKRVSSTTTKVRPVFNGSSKTETGISLNQCLCVGPIVQPESLDILLRFRERQFVLKSDIEKMYRQIFIAPQQRNLQKILWRSSPSEPLRHYELNTVTFGLSPSPFIATRALNYIADNCQFPEAAAVIKSSFYVDDLVFSFDSVEEGKKLQNQLRYVMASSRMPMRKWSSNSPELVKDIPLEDIESINDESTIIKTLGLVWSPVNDTISFSMKPQKEGPITKASVLSEIASIYDPIGLIGPVILLGKLHMKPLRTLKWTEEIPEEQKRRWIEFTSQLEALNNVRVNRHAVIVNPVKIQLHGFGDASEQAYGAVVYLRSSDAVGNVQVSLICSKSRVSPPKQKSIARLELCAAVLLSKLVARIVEVLTIDISNITLWSDSMIALYWIASEPYRLSTFVGNRVAAVQELLIRIIWRHILGILNPGDYMTHGLKPNEIAACKMWWNGPDFLSLPESEWPESLLTISEDDPEISREMRKSFIANHDAKLFNLIETRFSSFKKLVNCFAYIRRLAAGECLRNKGHFSIDEIDRATLNIVRILQQTLFPLEYKYFTRQLENPSLKEEFPSKSSIISLFPFMDSERVIRVGGRLHASPELTRNQKHQVILPHCHFVKLIVRAHHKEFLHPGPMAMLSFVREKYWPVGVKPVIRQVQHECVLCFRTKPVLATQLMGNLPVDRVTMSPPFTTVAVDYAGHFNLRSSLTKKSSIVKGYIALFKCMSTGAIHLEAVTSLSTPAFITVFDRFISRRGLATDIYSDNGTQFVGADNEFAKILKEIEPAIGEFLKEKRVRWHFTTPVAPHAGGYYESGVKTMKHHLTRECANRSFDYEQFSTLLCKIEAIINSRPLMPMSDDPTDLQVLTPAHFLIGRSLIAKPERDFIPVNAGRLDRFNSLQQVQQKFWASWYHDYLHHLQTRPQKFRAINEFHIGDLVLLKDQNLPPLKWLIGRIIALFPDKMGIVRRVRVKTPTGEKDRHVKYLCFLPAEESSISSARGENVS